MENIDVLFVTLGFWGLFFGAAHLAQKAFDRNYIVKHR
jgi:hypothetical protein